MTKDQLNTLLRKLWRHTWKSFIIVTGLLIVLYAGLMIYVSANKKSLLRDVTAQVSAKLDGKVTLGDAELTFFRSFPHVAVLLHDVSITDTMFQVHHHKFLEAKEMFANLSLSRLIRKEAALTGFRLKNASIYMFTDTLGYTNTYLMKPKKDSSATAAKSRSSNVFDKMELEDVNITLEDQQRDKLHKVFAKKMQVKVREEGDKMFFETEMNMHVDGLGFNLAKGSFLKNKDVRGDFELRYDRVLNQLQFDSINLNVGGQKFNFTGRFDLGKVSPLFSLRAYTNKIDYKLASDLMPERIAKSLSIVALDKPLDVRAFLVGPLKGGDPSLQVFFESKGTHMATPFLDFDDAKFTGFYTNEVMAGVPRKDPNSAIVVNSLDATWHDLPVKSKKITIMNLTTPTLTCDLNSNFPLTRLNELIGSSSLVMREGTADMHVTYAGPIVRNNNTNSFLNGFFTVKNGNMLYAPRDVEMKNISTNIVFKNSDVFIQDMRTAVLGHSVVMHGFAKNLLTLINTEPNKVNINWDVFAPSVQLSAFTYLLKKRKQVKSSGSKSSVNDIAGKIDNMLDAGSVDVTLKTNSLNYKKFTATNVLANIVLLQDRYLIKTVQMDQGGGHMNFSGSLVSQANNIMQTDVNVNMQNVDVKKVFAAFDNFGQDGITSESLEGQLTSTVKAGMRLNEDGSVIPSSVAGVIDFSLKNGGLFNYEPIKKMQRFIFKNRDFDNIRFAEIKDKLEVNQGDIKINRMEIQSTVFSLFIEGIYSRRGKTDISIQVPLSNLKKKDADYNPINLGLLVKKRSIYLRGRPGDDGNIKFKIDLFNKFDKENALDSTIKKR